MLSKKKLKIVIFIVLSFIIFAASHNYVKKIITDNIRAEEVQLVTSNLNIIRYNIESLVTNNLVQINSVATYIALNPKISVKEFNELCEIIFKQTNNLLNIAAAPDFKITYVYPLKGNEKILGVRYQDHPEQWPQAKKAHDKKQMVINGPLNLIQGGSGLIGRIPVFTKSDDGKEKFWGLVSSVINTDDIFSLIDKYSKRFDLKIAVRGKEGLGMFGDVFYGDKKLFKNNFHINQSIKIPQGVWIITGEPVNGWTSDHSHSNIATATFVITYILLILAVIYKSKKDEKLFISEQRFKDVAFSSSDWVWEIDASGTYTYAAGNVEEIIGYTPEQMIGKSPFDLMPVEEKPVMEKIFQDILKNKSEIRNLENWNINKNGEPVCLLTNGVPVIDDNGKLTGFRGIDKDITKEKRNENILKETNQLMDMFFSQSLTGFFFMMLDEPIEWDENTDKDKALEYVFKHQRITKINQSMLKQYRAKEDEFIGLTPTDFFAHEIEKGKKIWREFFDSGNLKLNTKEKRFDGTDMIIEGDYIVIRNSEGKIKGHFGVQRDVTNEREAEKQLERYIEIVDKNVITSQTDLDGNIIYASKAFAEISGYTVEELMGENHNIVKHPDMENNIFKEMWAEISKDNTWHGEVKNLKKGGGFYWVDTNIYPLFDSLDKKYGYMAVRQDITDKKRIEEISITDKLTEIFNRSKLDEALHEEFERFNRYENEFSLILFDIDHFKSVNDNYGHLTGDYVLKTLAGIVKEHIRNIDILGRWGGEEFLIISPNTDISGAETLAEHIRETIEEYSFDEVNKITCSFGVASIKNAEDTDDLLKKVDTVLYESKENGRNRVTVYRK